MLENEHKTRREEKLSFLFVKTQSNVNSNESNHQLMLSHCLLFSQRRTRDESKSTRKKKMFSYLICSR